METKKVVNLPVHIFENRAQMGVAAAADAAERINAIIEKNGVANIVFAAAPSQDDLLENLLTRICRKNCESTQKNWWIPSAASVCRPALWTSQGGLPLPVMSCSRPQV